MNHTTNQEWMLVVEDQLDLWMLLRMALRRTLPQVEMVHAGNKRAALTCLRSGSAVRGTLPRMILQDLHMPDLANGLGLVRQLKEKNSPYQPIPVVVMSLCSDQAVINETYRLGANAYVVKPLGSQEWSDFLKQVQQYWWETAILPLRQDSRLPPDAGSAGNQVYASVY